MSVLADASPEFLCPSGFRAGRAASPRDRMDPRPGVGSREPFRAGLALAEPRRRDRRRRSAGGYSGGGSGCDRCSAPAEGEIESGWCAGEFVFLGLIDDRAHFALDLSAHDAPLEALRSPALAAAGIAASGLRFGDLRQFGAGLARHEGALLALARAMMFWHSRHRFCGVCGAPTRSEEAGHVRRCTEPAARRCISRAPTRR